MREILGTVLKNPPILWGFLDCPEFPENETNYNLYERTDLMFIYNIKINGKALVKILFLIIAIVITIYFAVSAYKIYNNSFKVKDETLEPDVMYLSSKNYTNILKVVHDNTENYIGKEICFTGYVYRAIDFKESEFVLARDMIISSDMQTLIVGFLCDYKNAKDFADESWVELTGEITLGTYHGDMPIIKVKEIKQIEKPKSDIYAYPPDESYVPTSNVF